MTYAPMLSWIAASRFIVFILHAFCLQFKIPASNEDIINITPKKTCLANIMEDNAAEILVIVKRMSKDKDEHAEEFDMALTTWAMDDCFLTEDVDLIIERS